MQSTTHTSTLQMPTMESTMNGGYDLYQSYLMSNTCAAELGVQWWPMLQDDADYDSSEVENVGPVPPRRIPTSMPATQDQLHHAFMPFATDDERSRECSPISIDTSTSGAGKKTRRREQNRVSQRAYRDRQRNHINELRSQVVTLREVNEKLETRNRMLEAALQEIKQFHSNIL